MLARAAVAGSAFAVAPVRYLVRPGTAWGVIRRQDQCPPGARCNDGYTAFCCEIQHGDNRCPQGTYVAGWWKCTDYRGSGLCHDQGYRYYLDCNRNPGAQFPGGCQCANGDCGERCIDCNHFRYGQCNTQVHGTTEVVCRLVICQHPGDRGRPELQRDRDGRRQHLQPRGGLPGGAGRSAARQRRSMTR